MQSPVLPLHVVCPPVTRPSVCPSVTLVDQVHIGWKSWKLIDGKLAHTFPLLTPKVIQGEHGEIWGRLEVGWEKVACWSTKRQYL